MSNQQFVRTTATGRAVCRPVGLPTPRYGTRPCATWRGRDTAPRTQDTPNGFMNNGSGQDGRSQNARSTSHEG